MNATVGAAINISQLQLQQLQHKLLVRLTLQIWYLFAMLVRIHSLKDSLGEDTTFIAQSQHIATCMKCVKEEPKATGLSFSEESGHIGWIHNSLCKYCNIFSVTVVLNAAKYMWSMVCPPPLSFPDSIPMWGTENSSDTAAISCALRWGEAEWDSVLCGQGDQQHPFVCEKRYLLKLFCKSKQPKK